MAGSPWIGGPLPCVDHERGFQYCGAAVSQKIQAVVFDFGGVLTLTPGPDHWGSLLAAIYGADGHSRLPALQGEYHAHRDDFDRGRLSALGYWAAVLTGLGVSAADGRLLRRLFEVDVEASTRQDRPMVRWAARLRAAGFTTGILSNMPWEVLERIEETRKWLADFSPRIYSCHLGLVKPEAAIYRALLEELTVPPQSVLFLDDRERNVRAARELGMAAECFVSFEQILPVAVERYGLPAAG